MELRELGKQIFRYRPIENVEIFFDPRFGSTFRKHTMTLLKSPTKGNLCRSLAKFISNRFKNWILKNITTLEERSCSKWTQWRVSQKLGQVSAILVYYEVIESKKHPGFFNSHLDEPFDLQYSPNLSCCHDGWHSTWLTEGGTQATSSRSPCFLMVKLLTPIAQAFPESKSASMALHMLSMSGVTRFSGVKSVDPCFVRTGQWICYKEVIFGVTLECTISKASIQKHTK